MTCAACQARVERKLNRVPGVTATVNLATERARAHLAPGVRVEDAVAAVEATGYTAALLPPPGTAVPGSAGGGREGEDAGARREASLRRRLVVGAALAVPVALLSMVPAVQFPGWAWVALVLAAPVVTWAAWPFHRAALLGLRHGAATMDTLVSLGVTAATAWSVWALASGRGHHYLEVAAVVTVLVLAGRVLEARARRRSGAAVRALAHVGAKEAALLRDGVEVLVPVEALAVGDRFVVRPGERIATDGVVEEGTSAVDAAVLTGESVPVEVGPGAAVTGATTNAGGRLVVRATRVGADTQLARITRLVEEAQTGKAAVQRLVDRVSAVFVPVVVALAVLVLAGWLLAGAGPERAVGAAVAVLIIACPCALGLATPTALVVGTGRAAQLGVVVRGPQVLEPTRRVDTVVLDKTGTVTTGRMALVDAVAAPGEDANAVLALAGAVEDASEHPVGRSLAAAARERTGPLTSVEGFANAPGRGVRGVVAGRTVFVGSPSWVGEQLAAPLPDPLAAAVAGARERGRVPVVVAHDGAARGVLVVADAVRPGSRAGVAALRRLGLRPVLLTGDGERAAAAVAAEVGIAPGDVLAGVLPEGKAAAVRALQEAGSAVAVVGDGVNDAAALAQADLGIAMGSGTDAAIEASDLTLVRTDLRAAADAVALSRRTLAVVRGNLFWAFAYNCAAIPLAASGLLSPVVASAAMGLSSVFVVTNSLRLRRFQPVA